mmetsp:Transcript_58315/g.80058  ORF Transcript_58315/g.80058 Transcript_58315/m.80058 type:complete len:93 (-) Transcript_58315:67-345(-)
MFTEDEIKHITEFKDHLFPVNNICFAPNPQQPYLASCGNDTIVNMFDYEKEALVRSFLGGHTSFVTNVKFSPEGNLLLSTGIDNYLFLWDVR